MQTRGEQPGRDGQRNCPSRRKDAFFTPFTYAIHASEMDICTKEDRVGYTFLDQKGERLLKSSSGSLFNPVCHAKALRYYMCCHITNCLCPVDVSRSGVSYMIGNIFLRKAFGITCLPAMSLNGKGSLKQHGIGGKAQSRKCHCLLASNHRQAI